MKLSEFRTLIIKIYETGIKDNDFLTTQMSPAEYFAYKSIKTFKEEIESRKENMEYDLENLGHPENDGFAELEFCIDTLGDIIELFDAYLSGDDEIMESMITPDKIHVVIDR